MTVFPGDSGLRSRLAALLFVALIPGFALLAWLRWEMHALQKSQLERSVLQLAQLAAEGQAGRNHGATQLLVAFASAPPVRSADPVRCREFFRQFRAQTDQSYANIGLFSPSGEVVCSAVESVSMSAADRPYFREVIRTGRPTVSGVITGRITGRSIVTYTLPVKDGSRLLGVVFASRDVASLRASLARVQLPDGGMVAIVDRDGVVAARIPAVAPSQSIVRVGVPEELRTGAAFVREFVSPDGQRRLYAAVPVDAGRSMYAVAGMLTGPVIDAADQRVITALLILLGCTVVVFTTALIGAEREIRRPILRLLSAVGSFGRGEGQVRAGNVGGAGELRDLGRGFDHMADLLATRQAQMRQSQRLEAVGQLAGGVAHDFNNILTAIIGFGEELRSEVKTTNGREYLNEVLLAADRAKELTRQLLTFSRRQVMQPSTLQLNTIIAEFTALLQRVIGEDITLVTKLGSDLGNVRADRTQIEQVLMNLVVNARDAMPDGGLLTIETSNVTFAPGDAVPDAVGEAARVPPGDYVRLLVSDTGCGIDADTQARMFEPFFSTKGTKGTGLGLAMVYGIVRQSDGHISCWSDQGVGTTFCILLPRSAAAVEAAAPETQPAQASASGAETILVVEDEPSVRMLAATVLRHRGYEVVEAASGDQALERLDGGLAPDCLLCDLVMPGMNGHQVAAAVRSRCETVRVVYMSGYDDHHALASPALPGAAFIQKPFTPDALARQVRSALDSAVAV